MTEAQSSEAEVPVPKAAFATTHWSVVLAAGRGNDTHAIQALEQLCRTYWDPLYAFIRRRGYHPEDARDLTQDFFARLLAKHSFSGADQTKGRFRSFLLGALKHFLADVKDQRAAQKRGGGYQLISWEQDDVEQRLSEELTEELAPDSLFDRRWALTLLAQATARLRAHYEAEGQSQLFNVLKIHVTGEQKAPSYAASAAKLNLTESAVKSAVFRLRRRYHELVREEVAHTVATPKELEEEIRHLMKVFSRPSATL